MLAVGCAFVRSGTYYQVHQSAKETVKIRKIKHMKIVLPYEMLTSLVFVRGMKRGECRMRGHECSLVKLSMADNLS